MEYKEPTNETERVDKTVEVQKNGLLKIVETKKETTVLTPDQAKQWIDNIDQKLKELNHELSSEYKKKIEDAIGKLKDDKKDANEKYKKAEEIRRKELEKDKKNTIVNMVKKELEKTEDEAVKSLSGFKNGLKEYWKDIRSKLDRNKVAKLEKIFKRL